MDYFQKKKHELIIRVFAILTLMYLTTAVSLYSGRFQSTIFIISLILSVGFILSMYIRKPIFSYGMFILSILLCSFGKFSVMLANYHDIVLDLILFSSIILFFILFIIEIRKDINSRREN